MKKIAMIISMLLLPIFFINAQNLIKLTLSACHSTANTFYFDLLIKNDGSGATGKSMVLNSFAFGIEFDYLGIGGGNLQIQYVDNSSTLHFNNISNFQNKTSVPYISIDNPRFNPITKQLQIVSPSATCTDGTVMAPSSEFRIGTFKVTNPNNDFTANSLAKLKFNITSTSGGFTQTKIQEFYDGACTINVTKWCSVNLLPTICFQPIPQVIETSCDNSGLVLNRTCIIPTTTMHAGVGEVLTITPMPGQGFGGTFAIGDVKLIDASNVDPNPNNDPSYALDTDDWNNPNNPTPPWDDQKIQVVLSSHSLINGEFFNPGSGKVKVIDINGNVFTSTTDLNIEYSISNSLNLGIKKTDKLARYKCDNGIKFYLGNNIGINSPERHDIEAACKTWSDYLNIDVKLSLNQQPPVVWELDYLSIISYANPNILNNTLIPMKTFSYITGCNTASSGTYNEPFITQADIIINPNYSSSFHYGKDDWLPPGKFDFYAMILHEIGHALGLKHVMNENDIMFRFTHEGAAVFGTAPGDRITLTGCASAVGELNKVVVPSQTTQFYFSCPNINTLVNRNVSSPQVSSPQSISSNNVFCANLPLTLTSSTSNYSILGYNVSNQWLTNPIQTTQSILASFPGSYTLNVTQSNLSTPPNTCTSSTTVNVLYPSVIYTQPISGIYACEGSTLKIIVDAPFGSTYLWQRSSDGIKWIDLKNNFFYDDVTTDQLNILYARRSYGFLQYYRCIVNNGPNFCPEVSQTSVLQVDITSLPAFATVYAGDPPFQLYGGWPLGGVYGGDNVACIDQPWCNSFAYSPPPLSPPLNPPVNTIYYETINCFPLQAVQQIQIIYCSSSPPCDYIVSNLNERQRFCLTQPYIDIPYMASGTFASNNVFTAYLSDVTGNSFLPLNPIGKLHSSASIGTIHCSIHSNTPYSANYRIRIDSDNLSISGQPNPYDIEITKQCNDQRNDLKLFAVGLFPNPSSGYVTVNFLNNDDSKKEIALIDLQGRVCVTKYFNNVTNNVVLDISMLKDGLYIISIKSDENIALKKLIVANN